MVAEKAAGLSGSRRILPDFPDWHLQVVAAGIFKNQFYHYEQSVQDALLPIRNHHQHGFMKGTDLAILYLRPDSYCTLSWSGQLV